MSQPIPLDFWWPRYRDALFILSNTFEPGKDFTKTQMADAMKCFIISITKLLSDDEIRNKWMNFIIMTKDVANSLLVNLSFSPSLLPSRNRHHLDGISRLPGEQDWKNRCNHVARFSQGLVFLDPIR